MSTNQSPRGNKNAMQRLADDLAYIVPNNSFISAEENEMLSLMVDETLKGVDLKTRYPIFYQKLLNNAELRQAFVDILESVDGGQRGQLVPIPAGGAKSLAFLNKKPSRPRVEKLNENHWKIKWKKTVEQLRNVFFPPNLAFRSDPNLFDDSWFILLREDVNLAGSTYSALLECGVSKEMEDALSPSLSLAATFETPQLPTESIVYATLHWGEYNEKRQVTEGRVKFPDIPFAMTFDRQNQIITSELDLTLEIGA